jgi:small conductance mechanosensitive channel
MENILSKLQEWIVLYGVNVLAAIAILVIGRWAAMVVRAIVRKVLQRNRVDETLILFASRLTYVAVLAFVVIAALAKLGIQTTSFIAGYRSVGTTERGYLVRGSWNIA